MSLWSYFLFDAERDSFVSISFGIDFLMNLFSLSSPRCNSLSCEILSFLSSSFTFPSADIYDDPLVFSSSGEIVDGNVSAFDTISKLSLLFDFFKLNSSFFPYILSNFPIQFLFLLLFKDEKQNSFGSFFVNSKEPRC